MAATRLLLISTILLVILSTCEGHILESILHYIFGINSDKRSMSELITGFLDEIFPKDDMDTETMKNIYTMYAEDGNNLFSSQYEGVDYLLR